MIDHIQRPSNGLVEGGDWGHSVPYRKAAPRLTTITISYNGGTAMAKILAPLAAFAACSTLALSGLAWAQTPAEIPQSIVTPDKVESRLGTLEFKDGAPSAVTVHGGRQHRRPPQRLPEHRGEGQRSPHLLRTDGRQVAVPEGQ